MPPSPLARRTACPYVRTSCARVLLYVRALCARATLTKRAVNPQRFIGI